MNKVINKKSKTKTKSNQIKIKIKSLGKRGMHCIVASLFSGFVVFYSLLFG